MANQIGTVTFDLVAEAEPAHALQAATEVYARPGIDGHETSGLGKRGRPFAWRGCFKWNSSSANAITHIGTVEALEGTTVTIVDPWGTSVTSVLVRRAVVGKIPQPCYHANALAYMTVAEFELQRVA